MTTQPVFSPRATTIPVVRYLVALADYAHFGRAAAACSVAQPTLSAQVAQWERRMHVQVFERSGSGVRMTPIGSAIIAQARTVLAGIESLEHAASTAKPPFFGPVRLGVIPTVGPYLLPTIVPALEAAFPELELIVREGQTEDLLQALDDGRLDLLMLADLPGMSQNRMIQILYDEPFYVAIPRGHRLAAKQRISAADLVPERLLLLDEGHCLRDQALEVCHHRDASDRAGADWRATSLETLRQLVALGRGCTILPALAVHYPSVGRDDPSEDHARIVVRPLSSSKAGRSIALIWRASDRRSESYRQLVPVIRKSLPRDQVRVR